MARKAADDRRKTTVNRSKTTLNRRISGSCYKSSRLSGAIFRRNSSPRRNLELPPGCVELMCNAHKDLRPILTDGSRQSVHKNLPNMDFGDQGKISTGGYVKRSITIHFKSDSIIRSQTGQDLWVDGHVARLVANCN